MYSCFENKLPKYDSEHETYVLFKEFFEYFPRNFLVNSYLGSLVLRFIIRIAKFTGHKETWKDSLSGELLDWWGTLAIDGISVLQTLQGKNDEGILPQERIIFIPKTEVELDVLCPDLDVINEIQRSMKQPVTESEPSIRERTSGYRYRTWPTFIAGATQRRSRCLGWSVSRSLRSRASFCNDDGSYESTTHNV